MLFFNQNLCETRRAHYPGLLRPRPSTWRTDAPGLNELYKLLKMAVGRGLPRPVKLAGLAAMFRLRRRTAGVFLDPVLACNLRCRMCYFSDQEKRASMKGIMTDEELQICAKALFPYAIKLQIGCGAEPTLYPELEVIIKLGRSYNVPYISLTTNGQLTGNGKVSLETLVRAGLNELTLSLHGTTKGIYENLMPGASFDTFRKLTDEIARVKKLFPDFKMRVNYTVNSLNVHDPEGSKFWDLWQDGGEPDIVQLRPVQKIGNSDWQHFDPKPLVELYDSTIGAIVEGCRRRGITCLAPNREDHYRGRWTGRDSNHDRGPYICLCRTRWLLQGGFQSRKGEFCGIPQASPHRS